jgi:N-acetylmuramoyl-L-alanine amidase
MSQLIPEDNLAAMVIRDEAGGEPYEGKVAVAEVILTRTAKKFQSDGTVTGTLLWPYAFSGLNTTAPHRTVLFKVDDQDPTLMECFQAWETAKAGSSLSNGADSYFNPSVVTPKWAAQASHVVDIGRHSFYIVARRNG